jgi:hypothetical protein
LEFLVIVAATAEELAKMGARNIKPFDYKPVHCRHQVVGCNSRT